MARKVVMKIRGLKSVPSVKKAIKKGLKEEKIAKVIREYKRGKLHSGSKKGPKVTSAKQAIAIGLSEARRQGKPKFMKTIKIKRKK
jgi:hypothetical protein